MASRPSPVSAAGGAKYHTLTATAKWAAFRSSMSTTATHTVAERERKDREREAREVHNTVEVAG